MKKLVQVTIGISFYNAEISILDAVRSVFAQTHHDWELILIDDGSSDGSLARVQGLRDPRVRIYSDGKNKKLATRLNEISQLARYPFIARMDADDLMSRDRIATQLDALLHSDGVDLVSCGVVSMSNTWNPTGIRQVPAQHAVIGPDVIAGRSGIVHAAVLGRREWFLRNPYDESLPVSQDTNLWIRAFGRNDLRVQILPEPMYFYREDGNVNLRKLRLAYGVHRRTILKEYRNYDYRECIKAFAISCLKSSLLIGASRTGYLSLLRARRNSIEISPELQAWVECELKHVLGTELPLNIHERQDHEH